MPDLELWAEPRTVLGKRVARLRRAGLTPANIYGHNVASQAIELPTAEFQHLLRAAGGARLLTLNLSGETSPRMVLIRHVSRKPTTDQVLHVDFYQVSMSEKTTVEVPLVLVGVAPVADIGDGVVLQQISSLAVDCLPADIPEHIEIDISNLTEVHSAVHVSDLVLPPKVSTNADPSEVLVSVAATVREEQEAAEAAEAAAEEPVAQEAGGGTEPA